MIVAADACHVCARWLHSSLGALATGTDHTCNSIAANVHACQHSRLPSVKSVQLQPGHCSAAEHHSAQLSSCPKHSCRFMSVGQMMSAGWKWQCSTWQWHAKSPSCLQAALMAFSSCMICDKVKKQQQVSSPTRQPWYLHRLQRSCLPCNMASVLYLSWRTLTACFASMMISVSLLSGSCLSKFDQ